jgi:catechol 2,3-dioxygenase-like lactoylglutathione lyase family enzyme
MRRADAIARIVAAASRQQKQNSTASDKEMRMSELRLVLTVDDFEHAAAFFRDTLGLRQLAVWENDGGHAVLLDAGRATLEIFDQAQARAIDEIEVGRRVAGQVRVAFRTADSESKANDLVRAGARIIGGPVTTPWGDRNIRLQGPDGIQMTLFTPPEESSGPTGQ